MRAQVAASPCAACRMLRRRCGEKCVLAPYFPSNDLHKFATAHKIFGASNIIKLLQDLPRDQRADAVTSMVYEASARIRDPVYGCAGVICHMQSQLCELQSQLASAQAEILTMRLHQANLLAFITGGGGSGSVESTEALFHSLSPSHTSSSSQESNEQYSKSFICSDEDPQQFWDSLLIDSKTSF
ncbi:hypothetical protein SUGI_0153180 [Cryptomeria japonica]|nr:hypothetical protein SUGI_0153180 [Cryptomeria japonica]